MPTLDPSRRFHPASAPDYVPVEPLRGLQLERLKRTVRRAHDRVPLFRSRCAERGVSPDDLATLEDLARFPFSVGTDLRDAYPFGLLASPMEEVARLHASTGSGGNPTVVAYTRSDLEAWTQALVRCLASCGLGPGEVVHNAFGYGLLTGGLGTHYGAEALGATVIPVSGGNTDRQIAILRDFGVTAICCTPSYFVHVVERARELGADFSRLRTGIFGAEPWSEAMRRRIEADTGIAAFDLYGVSEVAGPGVAVECFARSGLHVLEDHVYPEIVDPASGEVLPDGVEGELVLTTLSRDAMPMIRYRTRDLTAMVPEPCACGRTLRRIRRIARRSDDVLIVRGVSVFPGQVEAAILAVEGTLPHFQIVLRREKGLDEMEVRVEVTPAVFSDQIGSLEALRQKLAQSLEHRLGLRARVSLVGPRTLQRSEGRAQRVLDERKM
ncbi:MAG: phenylacetate--CoA ligase [Deltaproteobacteria bacterium]